MNIFHFLLALSILLSICRPAFSGDDYLNDKGVLTLAMNGEDTLTHISDKSNFFVAYLSDSLEQNCKEALETERNQQAIAFKIPENIDAGSSDLQNLIPTDYMYQKKELYKAYPPYKGGNTDYDALRAYSKERQEFIHFHSIELNKKIAQEIANKSGQFLIYEIVGTERVLVLSFTAVLTEIKEFDKQNFGLTFTAIQPDSPIYINGGLDSEFINAKFITIN
ncbi:MAG: hypothetical protein KDD40_05110, partial [Bdellovibrionales bacterium]|nr:hypothetical protein [Bdellovibrionales bacterium]